MTEVSNSQALRKEDLAIYKQLDAFPRVVAMGCSTELMDDLATAVASVQLDRLLAGDGIDGVADSVETLMESFAQACEGTPWETYGVRAVLSGTSDKPLVVHLLPEDNTVVDMYAEVLRGPEILSVASLDNVAVPEQAEHLCQWLVGLGLTLEFKPAADWRERLCIDQAVVSYGLDMSVWELAIHRLQTDDRRLVVSLEAPLHRLLLGLSYGELKDREPLGSAQAQVLENELSRAVALVGSVAGDGAFMRLYRPREGELGGIRLRVTPDVPGRDAVTFPELLEMLRGELSEDPCISLWCSKPSAATTPERVQVPVHDVLYDSAGAPRTAPEIVGLLDTMTRPLGDGYTAETHPGGEEPSLVLVREEGRGRAESLASALVEALSDETNRDVLEWVEHTGMGTTLTSPAWRGIATLTDGEWHVRLTTDSDVMLALDATPRGLAGELRAAVALVSAASCAAGEARLVAPGDGSVVHCLSHPVETPVVSPERVVIDWLSTGDPKASRVLADYLDRQHGQALECVGRDD